MTGYSDMIGIIIERIKRRNPDFNEIFSVEDASRESDEFENHPENYAEGWCSHEELLERFKTMKYGFDAMLDLFIHPDKEELDDEGN